MPEATHCVDSLGLVMRGIVAELLEAVAGPAIFARLLEACRSPQPAVASVGQLLLRMGFLGQAERVFRPLHDLYPTRPAGLAGLAQAATQRKAWAVALERWEEVIAAFPLQDRSHWVASRARVLFEIGRCEQASAILRGLVQDTPNQPHGLIGLAHLAMSRSLWAEALAIWDEVLARYPQHDSGPYSRTARAHVLSRLGGYSEAEAVLRGVIESDPQMVGARAALMRVLAESDRVDEALRERKAEFGISEPAEFRSEARRPQSFGFGAEFCRIHQALFLGQGDLRAAYEAYDHRVRRFFSDKPKERFLVLNVFEGQGWPELCAFLGRPVPPVPFPAENGSCASRVN